MEVKKIIQVCLKHKIKCDKEPFDVTVGKKDWIFCCSKGFEQSLEDFNKTI